MGEGQAGPLWPQVAVYYDREAWSGTGKGWEVQLWMRLSVYVCVMRMYVCVCEVSVCVV